MTSRVVLGNAGMLGALIQQVADLSPAATVVLELQPSAQAEPPAIETFIERNRQRVAARAERERTKGGLRECARRRRQMEKQQRG